MENKVDLSNVREVNFKKIDSIEEFEDGTNIKLRPDGSVVVEITNIGTKKFIEMDLKTLVRTLQEADKDSNIIRGQNYDNEFDASQAKNYTGILPSSDTIAAISLVDCGETKQLVLYRKPCKTHITFYNERMEDIPMPGLIFSIIIRNNNVSNANVYAVKDSILKDETILYHCPLPNVYSAGNICWGANSLADVCFTSIQDLFKLPNMFMQMPFNSDGFGYLNRITSKTNGKSISSPRQMFDHLKTLGEFDYEILLESGHCKSIKNLVSGLTNVLNK